MPRFAVLEHDWPTLHWDLLLEWGPDEDLKTWRLESEPSGRDPIPAVQIQDHRRIYLDYEGPISGNRGQVRCWTRGEYSRFEFHEGIWLDFQSEKLQGPRTLVQLPVGKWILKVPELSIPEFQ